MEDQKTRTTINEHDFCKSLSELSLQDAQNYKNLLATIKTNDFCKALGELRAIETNSQTRTKKRCIKRILQSLEDLDKLGFEITIKPKK